MDRQKLKRAKRIASRIFTEPGYVAQQLKPHLLYKLNKAVIPISRGYSFSLNGVSLFLTWRCNLRCKMCNLWGEKGSCWKMQPSELNEELGIDELKRIIDGLAAYSPSVVLTGGEPLLYKDWYELCKYIKKKKLRSSQMLTNGTLLEENAEKLVDSLDSLNISLDGPPAIHNQIRGVPGLFERVISGIKAINQTKEKKGKKNPYINIAYTISELNYQYLEEMIDYLKRERLNINTLIFQHLEFTNEEAYLKTEKIYQEEFKLKTNIWSGFVYNLKSLDIDYLARTVNKIKKSEYEDIYVVFFPDFKEEELKRYYSNPSSFPQKRPKACLGPWLEALIPPNGDLWICPDYVVGNLKKERFKRLWNNEKARYFRQKLNKEGVFLPVCRCCGCFYVR